MSLPSETGAAFQLRQRVVQELAKRRDEMEPFIDGITDDWEGYLLRMADSAAWGGEPEILMAANLCNRPITVHRLVGRDATPIVTYAEELQRSAPTLHLLWRGVHYDLLLLEQSK